MSGVRQAAVAGTFYSNDPGRLAAQIDNWLAAVPLICEPCKVLIVPHAGYQFSAAVAASAYACLRADWARRVRHVVLVGPAHRQPIIGLALPGCDEMDTPLGPVAVDLERAAGLLAHPLICIDAVAHRYEHSLEVQLPFLQRLLPGVPVLPLLVGHCQPEEVAAILEECWGDNDTLIVVSSDLSHFLSYEQAQQLDAQTITSIEQGRYQQLDGEHACGYLPIAGLLANQQAPAMHCVDRCNSGDASGDHSRVVGYAAFVG